jgi:periplasmic protein TonB
MEILKDKNQRMGLLGTVIFHLLLLILFLFYGLTTPVPIPQQSILINFGTSNEGSGKIQPEEANAAPKASEQTPQEVKPVDPSPIKNTTDALTRDNEDAVSVNNKKTVKKEPVKEPEKEPEKTVNQKALFPGKSNTSKSSSSEGGTGNPGDQGDPAGDKNASSHTGSPTGGGADYYLGSRQVKFKAKFRSDCQEYGKVVVTIKVDRSGNVISAQAGGRGTTNTSACLMSKAEEAAKKTKWEEDPNATEQQVGTIIYNFILN